MKKGFTLIELLIVVAIIAILAAIAVPNFLEAQIRARVARVKADTRSVMTAVEAYAVDQNKYPNLMLYHDFGATDWGGGVNGLTNLSTPIAYMTNVNVVDPFYKLGPTDVIGRALVDPGVHYSLTYLNINMTREWVNANQGGNYAIRDAPPYYLLLSYGPDYVKGPRPTGGGWTLGSYALSPPANDPLFTAWTYDPTNGTISAGDILRFQ